MKKERIEVTKSNNHIHFYLVFGEERLWLFSQEYSMSVYEYFERGRSVKELRNHRYWRNNPRLAKTIERLPMMMDYVKKDYKLPYRDGKRRYFRTTYWDLYLV